MSQQQQQQRQEEKQRQKEESRQGSASQQRTADQGAARALDDAKQKKSDMVCAEAKVTEGRDGARNLRVEWIDVRLPHANSCRFAVTTSEGNSVEAVIEQKNYRQSYHGTSTLQTGIIPVAPIGTKGKVTVRDLTTGETFERPWMWHVIGVGAQLNLWALLKRLFT
jgi:hypothetical protein